MAAQALLTWPPVFDFIAVHSVLGHLHWLRVSGTEAARRFLDAPRPLARFLQRCVSAARCKLLWRSAFSPSRPA